MRILLCGADGFLGRHIVDALRERGHVVIRGVRRPGRPGDVVLDYRRDLRVSDWLPRLAGVDGVVNAVGILRERQPGDFDHVHHLTPAALFQACRQLGIRPVVQISALGGGNTPYLVSKRAGDAALRRYLESGVVLRPGLVFGADGVSTRFFLTLASLPMWLVPRGTGQVQPVHVDDVAEMVVRLLEGAPVEGGILEMPGPARLGFVRWLTLYRTGLDLPPAWTVPIPAWTMPGLARLAGLAPSSLLNRDSWAMLRAGNTGDVGPATALLGRPLRAPDTFISPQDAELLRQRAWAAWRRPLARGVLTSLWLGSAWVSAGGHPLQDSLARLEPFGLEREIALAVLLAATLLDLVMGLLTWLRPGPRLWQAQIVLVLGYSLLVALRLPAFLLDPFGPILKNLAVLALLLQLWGESTVPELSDRRRDTAGEGCNGLRTSRFDRREVRP